MHVFGKRDKVSCDCPIATFKEPQSWQPGRDRITTCSFNVVSLSAARYSSNMASVKDDDMVVATTAVHKSDERSMTADERRLAEMGTNHNITGIETIC